MTDKTQPLRSREWHAPPDSAGRPATSSNDRRWHISRQVDIVWIGVIVMLAISGYGVQWAYGLEARMSTYEINAAADRAREIQFQADTMQQLQEIHREVDALYHQHPK